MLYKCLTDHFNGVTMVTKSRTELPVHEKVHVGVKACEALNRRMTGENGGH